MTLHTCGERSAFVGFAAFTLLFREAWPTQWFDGGLAQSRLSFFMTFSLLLLRFLADRGFRGGSVEDFSFQLHSSLSLHSVWTWISPMGGD
jgi:hypothetical protein